MFSLITKFIVLLCNLTICINGFINTRVQTIYNGGNNDQGISKSLLQCFSHTRQAEVQADVLKRDMFDVSVNLICFKTVVKFETDCKINFANE